MAGDNGENVNRPEDTAFKQQRLKAWQPILTPTWVIGSFVVIGLIFIPVGVVLKTSSEDVFEAKVTYDEKDYDGAGEGIVPNKLACNIDSSGDVSIGDLYNQGYKALQANSSRDLSTACTLEFTLSAADAANANGKELYVYYELQKFYQNHRRYVKSRSDDQLRDAGAIAPGSALETQCDPQASYAVTSADGTTIDDYFYWPCGLIANSVFNDGLFYKPGAGQPKEWVESDIAWSSDMSKKFTNPPAIDYDQWQYNWQTYSQMGCYTTASRASQPVDPTAWERTACTTWGEACTSGGAPTTGKARSNATVFAGNCCECPAGSDMVSEGGIPPPLGEAGGLKDEHFVVWMRTAGLPTFRKLYAKIPAQDWKEGDKFQIIVVPNFVVSTFDGTKSIVVSTTSWLGGKNSVLGVAYIVVGSICWILALGFALKQYFNPRKLGDTKYLVWKNRA